jgi:hypothetical protein
MKRNKGGGGLESSSEDELCGASDDISDEKSYTCINKLAQHYQEEKQNAFLEMNLPFQQEKWWILVTSATNELKKHYTGVTASNSKGKLIMKFKRRVKNCSVFVWRQTDDFCKTQTEDVVAFLVEPIKSRRGHTTFPVSCSGHHVC